MVIFFTLLVKILPLYGYMLLGFIAGKYLHVKKESIAPVLIYLITPVIMFYGVVTTQINVSSLSLPVLCFFLSVIMSGFFYLIGKLLWKDSTKNIFAYASAQGNFGYFGLPVALLLFDKTSVGLYIMSVLGFNIFDTSVGFFLVSKGRHTVGESIKKVLFLPMLYAFFLGLLVHLLHINLGQGFFDIVENFKGAYIILGMMLVGLGISAVSRASFDLLFTLMLFFTKFLVWPLVMLIVFFVDAQMFHLYNSGIHKILLLLSIVPLAANTVAYATVLKVHPEKAAIAVLLSTLFALVYIPLIATFFLR